MPTKRTADPRVQEAEKSIVEVIEKLFGKLKDSATVKVEGQPRLFFPNGIELISVIVKVNAEVGVDIEVKVAGEKGVKEGAQQHTTADPSIAAPSPHALGA